MHGMQHDGFARMHLGLSCGDARLVPCTSHPRGGVPKSMKDCMQLDGVQLPEKVLK